MEEDIDVHVSLTNGGDDVGGNVEHVAKKCVKPTKVVKKKVVKKKASRDGRCKKCLCTNVFLIAVLVSAVLGFGIGFGFRRFGGLSDTALMWLGFPGEIFMRTLKLIILPLLITSIISGSATLDPKTNGKITMATVLYMLSMNAVGVLVGITMFFLIKPHTGTPQVSKTGNCLNQEVKLGTGDIFADMARNIFPDNIVSACFQKTQTYYKEVEVLPDCNANATVTEYVRTLGTSDGINVLGIIIFCLAVGIACGKVGEKAQPFVDFFTASCHVILVMLNWVIWLTPIGVLSLIATSIAKVDNIGATLRGLAMYVATVTAGIAFMMLVFIPVFYFVTFRRNPIKFLFQSLRPMMAGFAPPSSAIAIPEVLNVAENIYCINPAISRFVTLFGAATSRCGSAVFISVCSLFLAELDGVSLGAGQVLYLVVLATAATFAVPSVPSSSVICVIIILSSLNVKSTNIGMIMALEWLLDRVRTATNVLANVLGNLLIDKLLG